MGIPQGQASAWKDRVLKKQFVGLFYRKGRNAREEYGRLGRRPKSYLESNKSFKLIILLPFFS